MCVEAPVAELGAEEHFGQYAELMRRGQAYANASWKSCPGNLPSQLIGLKVVVLGSLPKMVRNTVSGSQNDRLDAGSHRSTTLKYGVWPSCTSALQISSDYSISNLPSGVVIIRINLAHYCCHHPNDNGSEYPWLIFRKQPIIHISFFHYDIAHMVSDKNQTDKLAHDIKAKVLARPAGSSGELVEYRSVHEFMTLTHKGTPADARQFRLAVKAKGIAIWPDDDPRVISKLRVTAFAGKYV